MHPHLVLSASSRPLPPPVAAPIRPDGSSLVPDEEDACPICLVDYSDENPRIETQCGEEGEHPISATLRSLPALSLSSRSVSIAALLTHTHIYTRMPREPAGHHFHLPCLFEWEERSKNTCPVCLRSPLAFRERSALDLRAMEARAQAREGARAEGPGRRADEGADSEQLPLLAVAALGASEAHQGAASGGVGAQQGPAGGGAVSGRGGRGRKGRGKR